MAYSFKHITIYIFDIHPAVSLLRDPAKQYFQHAFTFLQSAQEYRKAYSAQQPIATKNFTFKSLPVFELDKSHFWKSYGLVEQKNGQPDFWSLQMPFVGKYNQEIILEHKIPDVKITVQPSVYLSLIGWSVNLKIDIKGDIKKADLFDLVGWLSRMEKKPFSFRLGNNAMDKKKLFQLFNNLILEEVYIKGTSPVPGMKIINQFVISINSFEGDVTPYDEMTTYEEALMRSILFGRDISPVQLDNEKKKHPLTKTQITTSGTNFALTNFEHGCLIFLQREAKLRNPVNKEDRRKVICFAENCKNCLMISYLLWQFHSQSGAVSDLIGKELDQLYDSIPGTLKRIPQSYTSAFCTNLFLQHNSFAAAG